MIAIDDMVADVAAGRNVRVWTVGVTRTGALAAPLLSTAPITLPQQPEDIQGAGAKRHQ
jgi:beta-phosphoglucomutase-like phosphatase (HAD superfamily)